MSGRQERESGGGSWRRRSEIGGGERNFSTTKIVDNDRILDENVVGDRLNQRSKRTRRTRNGAVRAGSQSKVGTIKGSQKVLDDRRVDPEIEIQTIPTIYVIGVNAAEGVEGVDFERKRMRTSMSSGDSDTLLSPTSMRRQTQKSLKI